MIERPGLVRAAVSSAPTMRPVAVTLGAGLALLALAVLVVLSRSPLTVVASNSIPATEYAQIEKGGISACQPAAPIPSETSAIRIAIEARAVGPAVALDLVEGSRTISTGREPAGWGTAPTVTVPVHALTHAVVDALVCVSLGPSVEPFRVYGRRVSMPAPSANQLHAVALRMEYLRPSSKSWWSLVARTAKHLGLGRAASGAWNVFLLLVLVLAIVALVSRLLLDELP